MAKGRMETEKAEEQKSIHLTWIRSIGNRSPYSTRHGNFSSPHVAATGRGVGSMPDDLVYLHNTYKGGAEGINRGEDIQFHSEFARS
jgi:hypothetical protein